MKKHSVKAQSPTSACTASGKICVTKKSCSVQIPSSKHATFNPSPPAQSAERNTALHRLVPPWDGQQITLGPGQPSG
ncbi:hypothetical protein RRG08_046743 [Elysia crispata]|uniref:Uncharacterized protein n=1 Tax=Elysia crispata TaxID=231223 RepID=A0AAE0ZW27_9GAST|nr:hypothetical protein RRG08_046743 [Elysia crispata]